MSALPQPNYKETVYPRSPSPDSLAKSAIADRQKPTQPTQLSRPKRSAALQLVKLAQVGSSTFAALVMLGSIAVYLTTVRIPQLWSQEYETLENLQRQERQLVAIDEVLKYELAQQATAEPTMANISSQNTIFLPQKAIAPQQETVNAEDNQLWGTIPLGY